MIYTEIMQEGFTSILNVNILRSMLIWLPIYFICN